MLTKCSNKTPQITMKSQTTGTMESRKTF